MLVGVLEARSVLLASLLQKICGGVSRRRRSGSELSSLMGAGSAYSVESIAWPFCARSLPADHPSTILAPVEVVSPHWRCGPVQGTKSLLPIRGLTRIQQECPCRDYIVSIGVEFTTRQPADV